MIGNHSKTKEYFDTTKVEAEALDLFTEKARNQNNIIYEVFCENPHMEFTSHEIEAILEHKYPRSSIVRGINTLTKKGLLLKTRNKVIGEYGRPVYTWMFNKPSDYYDEVEEKKSIFKEIFYDYEIPHYF